MIKNQATFAACTILAKNQLSMARVVAESWHTHHPASPFFALLLDPATGFFSPACETFQIIPATDLLLPNLPGFFFRYAQQEAANAAKPSFFLHLLERYSVEDLVYLAPESLVLKPLDLLSEMLDNADLVLTDHITRIQPTESEVPPEADPLRSSMYAPGLLAIRESGNSRQLLRWWSDRISDSPDASSDRNLTAERWIDLVLQSFPGIELLRKSEYNIGYWNVHDHHLRMDGEKLLVNEEPAHLFNFRGFDPNDYSELAVFRSRYQKSDPRDAARLFSHYYDLLIDAGWLETSGWTYLYNFFNSGPLIPPIARRYYQGLGAHAKDLGDPFTWINESGLDRGKDVAISQSDLPLGINVIGHLTSEKGVGEIVRSNVRILEAARIPFVANDFVDKGSENVEDRPLHVSDDNPYRANLITLNADTLSYFDNHNPHYMRQRFNIGHWAWELSQFPQPWATAFGYLDEVWTLSSFSRDSIAASSRVPVQVVHCSLDLESVPAPGWNRASFGIPEEAFVFLFIFDFHSFMERKNPLGLIKAFNAAFGEREDVRLVIKSSHGQEHASDLKVLHEAVSCGNIQLIDKLYSREIKNALINTADCYISLHRSEGFGLTLAESMFYGKPVIATGYSGNTDFMSSDNSFLLPYRIAAIDRAHGPYVPGGHWADPDFDYAVATLRYVESNRETAVEIGKRGQSHVSTALHPRTIGGFVAHRLQDLGLLT